jgi:hypothetical protein
VEGVYEVGDEELLGVDTMADASEGFVVEHIAHSVSPIVGTIRLSTR